MKKGKAEDLFVFSSIKATLLSGTAFI